MTEVKVGDEAICKQCGESFKYVQLDLDIVAKGLELPKRCFKCRKENKRRAEIREMIIEELDKRYK